MIYKIIVRIIILKKNISTPFTDKRLHKLNGYISKLIKENDDSYQNLQFVRLIINICK